MRQATTEFIDTTEYDVVRVSRLHWYYSDDDGRRFHGITRGMARRRAIRGNR